MTADFYRGHAFQVQFSHQRPLSRGAIHLTSDNVFAKPKIHINLLVCDDDMEVMKTALRLARELVRQPAFKPYVGEEIEHWMRTNCGSSYHPCGTCKMDVDQMAVVDSQCRVRGIQNLRVADASIMPIIPSANLNCPTMMIGEKAADLIAGKCSLPRSNLPYFTDPRWQDAQR